MKRVKILFVMILSVLLFSECTAVQAAECDVEITAGNLEVRELSQAEMRDLSRELNIEMIDGESAELMGTAASYTAYEYSQTFDFSLEGDWVAQADAVCIVWHYTDGKVHLYSRTITVTRLATYDATRTYGRIVNTDGSLSYTTGDRVGIIGYDDSWDFAIDFRVTPTDASFNCYEI